LIERSLDLFTEEPLDFAKFDLARRDRADALSFTSSLLTPLRFLKFAFPSFSSLLALRANPLLLFAFKSSADFLFLNDPNFLRMGS